MMEGTFPDATGLPALVFKGSLYPARQTLMSRGRRVSRDQIWRSTFFPDLFSALNFYHKNRLVHHWLTLDSITMDSRVCLFLTVNILTLSARGSSLYVRRSPH